MHNMQIAGLINQAPTIKDDVVIARSVATRQSTVASGARQSPPFMRLLRPQGARNDN
jgi:hypothetical protein